MEPKGVTKLSEGKMTSKEKVSAVYPSAFVYQWTGWWSIYPTQSLLSGENRIGGGETEEAAWQNAAESLPARPEQDERCPECMWSIGYGHHASCSSSKPVESLPVEAKEKVCPACHDVKRKCKDNEYCNYPWYEPKPTPSTPSPKLPAPAETSNNSLQLAEPTLAGEEKASPSTPADAGSDGIGWCSSCDKIHEVARPKCPSCGDWLIFAGDDGVSELASSEHGIVERIGWEGIAGAIIDKVNMTPEDYVNEELVEQLKRYFVPKPRPDLSSIRTEQAFKEWWKRQAGTVYSEPGYMANAAWNAAKSATEPLPEIAWLEARWKSALVEGMDDYSNALIVAIEALKSYGGKG